MLRGTKWKLEKAKVKVVFRLQFHATNIPQSGWDKLFICFIPTESGKIIAKTSKANVRNGSCKWADPIYETTRLLQDSRNKQFDDKFYNLIVGMGTSRASILGETCINLAEYSDASNPLVVSLPLDGSEHGTVLHVTVQLLTAKTGFREFEQQFDRGLQSSSNLNREVEPSFGTSLSSELIKVNTETDFGSEPKELITIVEETGIHEEYTENYYADKHELPSIHESRDINGPTCSSDYSMDNELAIAHEENYRLKGSLEMAESSISELKLELSTLHNHANEMNSETQNIAQHLMAEISSGKKLEKEIMVLKSECSKFKDELQQLKEVKRRSKSIEQTQSNFGSKISNHQPAWGNGLLLLEDRIREIQQKICFGVNESNLNSDLEMLLGIVHDLEKETVQEPGFTNGFDSIERKSLHLELDEVKTERGNLIRKMDEMECYYEALVQELEENQKRILGEFQSLRYEHSTCVYTISTCKAETELTRRDMNNQILRFIEERQSLGCVNEELTKRVTASEARVRELEGNRERILAEFKSLKNEHSTCGDTISTCKSETELIRRDMNNQTLKFAKERHALGCLNEELEKRVMIAEGRVREVEEDRERVVGEFESLKKEHLTCVDSILTCKDEIEMLKLNERHDSGCVNEELEKRVVNAESRVKDLEEDRERILGEFESLKNKHSTCGATILTCKDEIELIRSEMNDKISKFTEERDALDCVNKELEKNRERILGEYESLKNEHLTCVDSILICKSEVESIRDEMNDKILKLTEEKDELDRVNKELESFKNEHLTCGDTISICKSEIELIRNEMDDKISKLIEEKHDLDCVNDDLKERVLTAEACVQEIEQNREQILKEFENLKNEHSTCGDMISNCKSEIESIRDETNVKISKFTKEKHDLERVNKELEKRVTTAESALARARSNYSIAVTQLQKDLDMLSGQVASMFETNQNLIKGTFSESLIIENDYEKHEKKDPEGPSESLRIAFMKEQCETTVQELKQQLLVSKRDGDNILFKLQDALDEIDSRKKSEASYSKKIEELSVKIVGLEAEFESIRAELECTLLNLECCKEEKEKMIGIMEECEEEKMKIAFELSLFKEQTTMKREGGDVAEIIELDRMKTERSILSMMNCGSNFQDLEKELVQLHKANEELGKMYPNFMDLAGNGNSLKRVLGLVIELAEALTSKNKSTIQFQSSFLKQHGDEEAVFKSFRDINELIKDMLEIKNKYVNVETELKEMHERYTQLSLQFAEVEGERQKLMMIVKNSRSLVGNPR